MTAAINFCVSIAGETNDKPIYTHLDIDPGQWAKIKQGKSHFPHELYPTLFDRCRNDVPLVWLADRRGYELVRKETAVEQENRLLKDRVAQLEHEQQVIAEFMRSTQARS